MLGIEFSIDHEKELKILCLGAHCDDIEIGCGGSILQLVKHNPNISIKWVVVTSSQTREKEASCSAQDFLKDSSSHNVEIKRFQDGFLPYLGADVKVYFEQLKKDFDPDIVFTHFREDLHQDHRLINELTWNTFRDHLILEYEIPKYDGDLGRPNFYIPVEDEIAHAKADLLLQNFTSQANKDWFDKETFFSIMRLRGMESRSDSKYSEAFYLRKVVLKKQFKS